MIVIKQLESVKAPLINKFYTLYKVRGRANKQDQLWVAYDNHTIIAACRLQHKPTFYFYRQFLWLLHIVPLVWQQSC